MTLSRCIFSCALAVFWATSTFAQTTATELDPRSLLKTDPSLQFSPVDALETGNSLRLSPPIPHPSVVDLTDEQAGVATIDLTKPPSDLWQRIRNGFSMPNLDDPLVAKQQAWYLNRPATLRIALARSKRYLHHIVEELEKRGMPTELALLPVIESSYNPQAHSPARALGMWQFIPSTGKSYKLKQNWWLDERRDILASTSAALDYLENIYQLSGDWHLALASYNWGEGSVGRAVAKNQAKGLPTDYLSLRMPDETRWYVPKLQAVKNIIADPTLFGFQLDSIPNKPYFGTVEVDGNMDVSVAANLAEIPLTEFIALNPAYSRPVIPGASDNPLVLPADKISTFLANLQSHEQANKPLSNWMTYTLKPKENIDGIAKRFGIAGARLRQLNGITKRNPPRTGMNLLIPGKNVLQAEKIAAAMPQTPDIKAKAIAKPVTKANGAKAAAHSPVKNKVNNAKKVATSASQHKPAKATSSPKTTKPVVKKPAGKPSPTNPAKK
jgi:membrane-bound lytic murein transglycosylase D